MRSDQTKATDAGGEPADPQDAQPPAGPVTEQPERQRRDREVEDAEEERRGHQAELRHDQHREQHCGGQCTCVVGRQHVRQRCLQRSLAAQDAGDQRDLQPRQRPDGDHDREEDELEIAEPGIGEEQDRRREPADQPQQHLGKCESRLEVVDIPRHPGPKPHRGHEDADDQRELGDGVAEQVARDGPGDQLIDQTSDGDHEGRRQKPGSVVAPGLFRGQLRMTELIMIASAMKIAPIRTASARF